MNEKRSIPFGRPWITAADTDQVLAVFNDHILTHGPLCKQFEAAFSRLIGGTGHCVSVSSCMAALHLSYLGLGIGTGDEVIVPALTHVATVHAVELVGATPIFVDCDSTGNMDPSKISSALSSRTKAISVVHFLGVPCNMPSIMTIAKNHHLRVVEDCALALGASINNTHVGLFGDTGCFSFYPVKHITTGEGGMFVTKDPDLAQNVRKIRGFGVDRTFSDRSLPGYYDVVSLGLNYRMSEMQAALGIAQLARFETIRAIRAANWQYLNRALDGVDGLSVVQTDTSSFPHTPSEYGLAITLSSRENRDRNRLILGLKAHGIGTSIYYPHPIPRLKYYRQKYGFSDEWITRSFPNAITFSDHSLTLPIGPHLHTEDLTYILETISRLIGSTP